MKKTLLFLMALIMSAGFAFAQTVIPLGLPDTGGEGAGNGNTQPGWNLTAMGVLDQVAAAKYLVLETEGIGDKAEAFGGIHLIYQGNDGGSINIGWTDINLNNDWVDFSRAEGQIVSIAIDLQAALGANYDNFLQCTWARFIIAYYPGGMTAIEGLGLTDVYLTSDFAKPDGAVDLTGTPGFIFIGSVKDILGGGGTTIAPSNNVPGLYIPADPAESGWYGANILLGNDDSVWPWSTAGEDGAVAFTPVKDATYHMKFNVTSVAVDAGNSNGEPVIGFRVRWIKDNTSGGYTQGDADVVSAVAPWNVPFTADQTPDIIPCYFQNTISDGQTLTYNVDFTMDGNELANGLVGNLAIRGQQGANGFVINWLQIFDAAGNMLVNYAKDAGNSIIQIKPLVSQAYGITGGVVVNAVNEKVVIYGIDGRLVKQIAVANNQTIALAKGLYIVKVGANKAVKVIVK